FFIGCEKILGAQLIAGALRAGRRVFQAHSCQHLLLIAVDIAEHRAAALVRIGGAGVLNHLLPRLARYLNHSYSSSQKCSLRYFSAVSQRTVTITAFSPRETRSRPTRRAAVTLPPDETPTSKPSRRASWRTM